MGQAQHTSWGVASLRLTVLPQTWGQMAVFTGHPAECLYQKPVCPGVVAGGCPLSTHPSSWMSHKVSLVGNTLEGLPPGSGSASGTWREISSCPGASAIALMHVFPYISRLDTALHHSLYLFIFSSRFTVSAVMWWLLGRAEYQTPRVIEGWKQ